MARQISGLSLFLLLRTFILLVLPAVEGYTTLSDESLKKIPGPDTEFDIHHGLLLSPILIPRVPGSVGSAAVLNHFVNFFTEHLPDWQISFQNSTSTTPTSGGKEISFTNLIVTRDPPWARPGEVGRLTLVAHYDSKLEPKGFIGATDSAAPCAMLMHIARSVDEALTKKWADMSAQGAGKPSFDSPSDDKGVQLLFLDGEEAFAYWTSTDSLYGARSLAAEWETTAHPALSTYRTPLSSISLFVLLDLLGAKEPTIPSYFRTTHWAYLHLCALESRLRSLGLFKSSPNHPKKLAARLAAHKAKKKTTPFKAKRNEPRFLIDGKKNAHAGTWQQYGIEDDHIPFLRKGVDILHMIPTPFPRVWHTMADDGEHLDLDTVEDWTKLFVGFVGEWMELEGFLPGDGKRTEDNKGGRKRDVTSKTEL